MGLYRHFDQHHDKIASMNIRQTLNQLARSRSDKILGGVCGGIGKSTDTPPWLWRAIFVAVALGFGTGILIYLVLWAFMPVREEW
jgi:phage shock protein C